MHDTPLDMELYQQLIGGDEAALEELIERHRTGLTQFAYCILHNVDDAQEIMIDTFAYLAVSGGRFRGKSSLRTYLYAIARNLSLKRLRKQRPVTTDVDEMMQMGLEGLTFHSAEDEWLRTEEESRLHEALQRVNSDYRQAILLVYMQGMSYKEAGEIMRKNSIQMNHLVSRGKKALRALLEGA